MKLVSIVVLLLFTVMGEVAPAQEPLPLTVADGPLRLSASAGTTTVTIHLDNGMQAALEITRLVRAGSHQPWHVAATVYRKATDEDPLLQGTAGVETLLLIRSQGHPGYLLDGPFRWPSQRARYVVRTRWRRTIRGQFNGPHTPLVWVAADDSVMTRTMCEWVGETSWECVGVPLNAVGVVLTTTPGEVRCSIPTGNLTPAGVEDTRNRVGAWGRLLVTHDGGALPPAEPIAIIARRASDPGGSPPTSGLDAVPDPRIQVDALANGVAWISASEVPADSWIEVAANHRAPVRLAMHEIAGAPAEFPLRLLLQPAELETKPDQAEVASAARAGRRLRRRASPQTALFATHRE